MKIVAYDPGDRWLGVSYLNTDDPQCWRACARVVDLNYTTTLGALQDTLLPAKPTLVLVEEFRMRPQGSNAFGDGRTFRVIGGIEVVAENQRVPVKFVRPGDPSEVLQLPLASAFRQWRECWPKGHGDRWNHAMSAWRLIGWQIAHSMSVRETGRKGKLDDPLLGKARVRLVAGHAPFSLGSSSDLVAPSVNFLMT